MHFQLLHTRAVFTSFYATLAVLARPPIAWLLQLRWTSSPRRLSTSLWVVSPAMPPLCLLIPRGTSLSSQSCWVPVVDFRWTDIWFCISSYGPSIYAFSRMPITGWNFGSPSGSLQGWCTHVSSRGFYATCFSTPLRPVCLPRLRFTSTSLFFCIKFPIFLTVTIDPSLRSSFFKISLTFTHVVYTGSFGWSGAPWITTAASILFHSKSEVLHFFHFFVRSFYFWIYYLEHVKQ